MKTKIAIDADELGIAGMHDEHAHHAHRHLHHLVGVRVIHEGPAFLKLEFVDESFSGLDVGLGQAADAIHAARHQHAVPVDCRVIGQLAGHEQAYLVALHCLDGGPWRLAVVAPQMRMDFAVNRRLKPSCAAFPGPASMLCSLPFWCLLLTSFIPHGCALHEGSQSEEAR